MRGHPNGIRPKTIWIKGAQGKGFVMEEMTEVFRRYIPKADYEALRDEIKGGGRDATKGPQPQMDTDFRELNCHEKAQRDTKTTSEKSG